MDIEFLVQRLEQYLFDECPRFFGNRFVNEEVIRSQIVQMRETIPEEIQRAQDIIDQRDKILDQARRDAQKIIAKGHEDAEQLALEHRVAKEARQQAQVIMQRAERQAVRLRSDADEYVFDALSQLQEELTRISRVVENGLQRLESDREQTLQQESVSKEPPLG